jgi:sigma-E factor negative regulatory protein RseC
MIEQTLTVVAVNGRDAELQAEPKKPCEGCNGKCGSQVFSKLFKTDKKTLHFRFDETLQIGQKVKLALDDSNLVKHSFYVYFLPLVSALMFAATGASAFQLGDGYQILLAIFGGLLGGWFAKRRVEGFKHDIKLIKIYPISLPLTQIDGD